MEKFLIKLILFVFIFLYGNNSAEAVLQGWIPPDDYGEGDSYEMGMESDGDPVEMESQSKNLNMQDILGDEQVFPFQPGLGN
tara:strand:+ start:68 stop:313 length:246 start_codon:yes stop_codon:yes gene_type:complete